MEITRRQILNKEQLQAVHYKKGPLLIIAGAGTGKTTVITERIKYLIEKGLAKPEEILALTFTEKASREMEERIDIALPYGYANMWVMTFHSFCERVLRQNALEVGLDPRFKLTTSAETVQLIRENLFKFKLKYFRPLGNPYKFIDGMIQHISRLQDEDISSDEYIAWVKKNKRKQKLKEDKLEFEKWEELANAYYSYEELKIQNGLMDFGDLLVKTLKLFRERPNVLREYQKQFKYILIDEFQDTNYAQNQLALLLAKEHQNITVVGDDDQSIYRFRGAAISNMIQFRKSFPKTKIVVLTRNYRSIKKILDKAYSVIQNNNPDRLEIVEKINKKLLSERERSKKIKGKDNKGVKFIHVGRVENEAEEVAKEILALVEEKKYDFRDFAILVRANNHSEAFIQAMQRNGIPCQFLGPGRLFRQDEIIDLISYLKVLDNFDDSVAFNRILSFDVFGINARDIAKLGNYSRKFNLSLFETAEKIEELAVSEDSKKKIKKVVEIIYRHLGLANKESAGQILYYFVEETSLLKNLVKSENIDAQKKTQNISKFFDKLKTYEVDHKDNSVRAVVDWINISLEVGESPIATDSDWTEINAVNILTVHSAKGLEFPVVFIVNLVAQRFPTTERTELLPIPDGLIKEILPSGDYHLQEERRLFYVAMTRAKDILYLTAANFYGEGKREKKLSPFIKETLGEFLEKSKQKTERIEELGSLGRGLQKTNSKKKEEKFTINTLSYSQIETFLICPLHYKLRYILEVPTLPVAAASFGISIHKTLREFYEEVKGRKTPNEKMILKILEKNWIYSGYISKEHGKEAYKKAEGMVRDFYKNGFNLKQLPTLMEHGFLGKVERPSNPKEVLKIRGTIDRVDVLPSGQVEIVDYKTGDRQLNEKEADKDLQLTFYALAVQMSKEKLFKGKDVNEIKLTLFYLNSGEKVTTTRTKAQLIKAREDIFKIKEKIENSDYKCGGGIICQNCEYRMLCQADL